MKFKQFAALPYRMREDDVEILLITTRKKGPVVGPQGLAHQERYAPDYSGRRSVRRSRGARSRRRKAHRSIQEAQVEKAAAGTLQRSNFSAEGPTATERLARNGTTQPQLDKSKQGRATGEKSGLASRYQGICRRRLIFVPRESPEIGLCGLFTGVLQALEEFPQFLFGLEVKLFTAAFRPTCRVPELIGAQGNVWHFRHSFLQLDEANPACGLGALA